MNTKEIKSYVIRSLLCDDNNRQIAVMERYINWLKNEPLHTGVEEHQIQEEINAELDQIKLAEEIFKPF